MNNSFYALIFRQKFIKRWSLMRNLREESLAEHSSETAVLAHALATIGNRIFHRSYDVERVVTLAVFHDMTEVYTGDLPTPIKYYSEEMRNNYKTVEKNACRALLSHLPAEFRDTYRELLDSDDDPLHPIVKAADKLSALIKCIEEVQGGNREFASAEQVTLESIRAMHLPEADYFLTHFLPAFRLSLDEMQADEET